MPPVTAADPFVNERTDYITILLYLSFTSLLSERLARPTFKWAFFSPIMVSFVNVTL